MSKKLLKFLIIPIALIMSNCSKDSFIEPPVEDTPSPEVPYVPSPLVSGRAVIAYVTYYGAGLPNPELCTHINYAFAELYVKDGKYNGFKLQGKESRFESVVALKKSIPILRCCFHLPTAFPIRITHLVKDFLSLLQVIQ